jgi:hypothetical protein
MVRSGSSSAQKYWATNRSKLPPSGSEFLATVDARGHRITMITGTDAGHVSHI